jgi:arylsulfatase A-like enzyme
MDAFAAQGLNITGALSGSPLCCPFRGSLISGQYAHRCVPGHEDRLPETQKTVAHAFNRAGYDTAYIGKWHLDGYHEREGRAAFHVIPPERRGGFCHWVGYENNNAPFDSWVHGNGFDRPTRLPGYETDCLTDLMISYLKSPQRTVQPFFGVLSVQPPHNPYTAPESFMRNHTPGGIRFRPNVPDIPSIREKAGRDLAGYYAMIENLDWNLGRILRALDETGLIDNTHVFFFSDHGDMHGSHGQSLKTTIYEESIRVPCLYRHGRSSYHHFSGRQDWVFNHVDYSATSLGLCGIDLPKDMQGYDYSPHIRSDQSAPPVPDSALLQIVRPTRHPDSVDRAWRGLVTRDGWKYGVFEQCPWVLFNLNEDPFEQANLAFNSRHRTQRERLHGVLADWLEKTEDPFPLAPLH